MRFLIIFLFAGYFSLLNAQILPKHYSADDVNKLTDDTQAGNGITDIKIYNGIVWIGTGSGLSKSTDNGKNWTNYYGTANFGEENISALDLNDKIVAVATAHSVEKDGESLPEGSGIKISTNNGETWNSVLQPLDSESDTVITYGINLIRALPVTTNIQNITYDLSVASENIWIASFAGGLRKSSDLGQSWERIILPPDRLDSIKPTDELNFSLQPVAGNFGNESNLNHRLFSVLAVNDTLIFAGTANGINRSMDGGKSWVKFNHQNQLNPISGNFVVALGYNEFNNSLWAATWRAEDQSEFYGVSASFDLGENWQTFLEGEKINNFGFKDGDVIAAGDDGIFRSNNNGQTWVKPTNIFDNEKGIGLKTNTFYSASSLDNDVWLGSDEGLVKLNETGSMWQGDWEILIASQKLSGNTDSYVFPNPFTPGMEQLKIKYSTSGTSQKVTIRILDFGMNLVKTVIQNAERNGASFSGADDYGVIDYWDGRDEFGNYVPNGVYFYRIDLENGEKLFGKILILQ